MHIFTDTIVRNDSNVCHLLLMVFALDVSPYRMEKTTAPTSSPQKLSRRARWHRERALCDKVFHSFFACIGHLVDCSSVFITFLDIAWRVTSSLTIIVRLAIAPVCIWNLEANAGMRAFH